MDSKQYNLEKEVIAILVMEYEKYSFLKDEDFVFLTKEFKQLQQTKGQYQEIIKNYPNLIKFEVLDSSSYLLGKRLCLSLTQSSFTRLLSKTYTWYSVNNKNASEGFILNNLKNESLEKDIFENIEFLPEYFKAVGIDNKKILSWSNYCKKRIKEIQSYEL